jgi:hypothetical protein
MFIYGTQGGIRAHITLCLRQVRIPIPSLGYIQQDSIFTVLIKSQMYKLFAVTILKLGAA